MSGPLTVEESKAELAEVSEIQRLLILRQMVSNMPSGYEDIGSIVG